MVYVGTTNPWGLRLACVVPDLDSPVEWSWMFRPKTELPRSEQRRVVSAVNAVQLFFREVR